MPRTINGFPVELVRLVLWQVKLDSDVDRGATFIKTFAVCQLWYEIAAPILYADLSFRLGLLIATRNPSYRCSSLSDLLGNMENLECFSLSDSHMRGEWDSEEFNNAVRDMLDKLPSSVRHLELDLGISPWFNTCDLFNSPHIYPALKSRINELLSLRLRLPTLCNDLFDSGVMETSSNMRSDSNVTAIGKTNIINTIGNTAKDPGDDVSLAPMPENSASTQLASWASSAIERGKIQNIGRFSIMSFEDRDVVWDSQEHLFETDTRFSAVNDRRVIGKPKLLKFPTRHRVQSYRDTFIRYRDSSGEGKDTIGPWRIIRQLAEGPVWVETKGFCRIPRTYFELIARFEGAVLKDLDSMSDEQSNALFVWFLTAKERKHGQLLHTQEFDGFEDAGPMTRDLTPGEKMAMAVIAGKESDSDFEYSSSDETEEEVEWSRLLKWN